VAALINTTIHGAERGFARPERTGMANSTADAPLSGSQVTPDFTSSPFPRLRHGGPSTGFSPGAHGTLQLSNFSGQAVRIRWAGEVVEQVLEPFTEGQEANAETARIGPGDTVIFADGTEFTVGEPVRRATEPISESLGVQRHLLAVIAGSSGLVQAASSAPYFRSLLAEIQAGRLTVTPEVQHRVADIFSNDRVRRDLDYVPHGQRLAVRQALVLEILQGRLTEPRRARDMIAEIRANPENFPGYRLGGAEHPQAQRGELLPEVSRTSPARALLERYGFTQGVDGSMRGWTASRSALEGLADPGQPGGPLVNLARRTRGALQTIYDRAIEIERLERNDPQSARLTEARHELQQAQHTVEQWEAHNEALMVALDRGQAMQDGNRRLFGLVRVALEPGATEYDGNLAEGGTLHATGPQTPMQRVNDRILTVDSNPPDE